MKPHRESTSLSCGSPSEPPDGRGSLPPTVQRWDDESEVVPRLQRKTTLAPEAMEELIALAGAESAGAARARARRISSMPAGQPLSPLLERLVARAAEVEQLRRLAGRDELTGLANRRTFNDVLERELARAARSQAPLALLLLDLDHLKAINDRFGHAAGDRVLRELSQSAEAAVRNGDLVARLGGDEFAVVLPGTALHEAETIGERIRGQLAAAGTREQPLGLSFGAAAASGAGEPAEDLLREADRALYRDKLARRSLRPPA